MNTEVSTSQMNLIVEAAGATIQAIVDAINAPPTLPGIYPGDPPVNNPSHRADWLIRYPALVDLNVVSPISSARRETTVENIDRWPWCGFLIDDALPDPRATGEEHFLGNLVCLIGAESEVFSMSLQEIYEVHDNVRSVLLLDKSLGEISRLGGVIDHIRWRRFTVPVFDELMMREPTMLIRSEYEIAFQEVVYR